MRTSAEIVAQERVNLALRCLAAPSAFAVGRLEAFIGAEAGGIVSVGALKARKVISPLAGAIRLQK